jgi:serum/glucocorticoid-regulated kinase 2
VTRKYYEQLYKEAVDQERERLAEQESGVVDKTIDDSKIRAAYEFRRKTREQRMSLINQHVKLKKKFIVAIKTLDMRESLDYWLTQYDRPVGILADGECLQAHFAKLNFSQKKQDNCKVTRHDFEQIKIIGRGAFSRVVLVRKLDTGRLYAMKIVKKEKMLKDKKTKPILNERDIMKQLDHPFIVKLYWSFQSSDELFFVMDICTGSEMFFHLGKILKFNENQAKFYFAEILEAF